MAIGGGVRSWSDPGASDRTEWVTQVRTLSMVVGDDYVQESLHPNHWGQLALRNCLRQAVHGAGGSCLPATPGVNADGEPLMTVG